jgi:hypothetical protein
MITISKINYGNAEVRVAWDSDADRWYLYVFNWERGQVTADPSDDRPDVQDRIAKLTDSGVRWVAKERTDGEMVAYLEECASYNAEYREVLDEVRECIENDKV